MKIAVIFLLVLLTACGSTNNNAEPKQKPRADSPKTDDTKTNNADGCSEINPFAVPSFNNTYSFKDMDGRPYLVKYGEAALMRGGHELFWAISPEHEGYRQQYKLECSCESCTLKLSDYYSEYTQNAVTDFTKEEVLTPSEDTIFFPSTKVTTLLIDEELRGNYYLPTDSTYQDPYVEISAVSITVGDKDSYMIFDLIDKLPESRYLLHYNSGINIDPTLPMATQQGNWFGVLKLSPAGAAECGVCHHEHGKKFLFNLSGTWSHYRSIAKDFATYPAADKELVTIDFSTCNLDELPYPTGLSGSWLSDGGSWYFDFSGNSKNPYDTRELHYAETASSNNATYRMIFTYGSLRGFVLSDPNRYNNLYTYVMEATKRDEKCWNLKHNLDDSQCCHYDDFGDYVCSCAYFGNPENIIPQTNETICRSAGD